jgi:hypothetical protein
VARWRGVDDSDVMMARVVIGFVSIEIYEPEE